MRILIYYASANADQGHQVRCRAFTSEAMRRKHQVVTLGIASPFAEMYSVDPRLLSSLQGRGFVDGLPPDWLVMDFPEEVPGMVFQAALSANVRTCILDADGSRRWESQANLAVVQGGPQLGKKGFARDHLVGSEYVILRREIVDAPRRPGTHWLVFGGSNDNMHLLEAFDRSCRDLDAFMLATTEMRLKPRQFHVKHKVRFPIGGDIVPYLSAVKAACVAMGMITWELALLYVPTYIFSPTERHLAFALGLEQLGFARVYPKVGLPPEQEFREFLKQPMPEVSRDDKRPDGLGASRILEEMERRRQ